MPDIVGSYNVTLESIGVNVSLAAAGPFTALHLYTNTHAQPLSLQFDFAHAASAWVPVFTRFYNPFAVLKNPPQVARASFRVDSDGSVVVWGVSRSAGSLSRRSPHGGVDVYFAAKVVVLGSMREEQQQPSGNVWCNGTLNLSSAAYASCNTASSSCGIWLQFPSCATTDCSLLLSASVSFVSIEQAWINMASELPVALRPDLLFPMVVHRTQQIWRESVSRVSVDAATSLDAAVKLYTAVYHTLMAPSIFSEGQSYPPSASVPSPPSPVYLSFDGSPHPWPNPQPYLTDMSMYCARCTPPPPAPPIMTVTLCSYGTHTAL